MSPTQQSKPRAMTNNVSRASAREQRGDPGKVPRPCTLSHAWLQRQAPVRGQVCLTPGAYCVLFVERLHCPDARISSLTCNIVTPTCNIVTPTCNIVTPTCNIVTPTCNIVTPTCNIVTPTCNIVTPTCNIVTPSSLHRRYLVCVSRRCLCVNIATSKATETSKTNKKNALLAA